MEKRNESYILPMCLIGIAMLIIGISMGLGFANSDKDKENTQSNEAPKIVIINNTQIANNTAILTEISKIKSILDEDDIWKAAAITLSEDEYTDKHLYDALIDLNVTDIDDKSDIDRFVVKDIDTNDLDTEKQDAEVIEEVRIYYENHIGDDIRITLEITSTIEDGTVEDIEYELA